MNGENINISGPGILVSPLDWGLGHATRCVPVIRELMKQGAEVFIGCGDTTRPILKEEFPNAKFLDLPDYDIRYAQSRNHWPTLIKQIPAAYINSNREHKLLKQYIERYRIKAVISDNRFGLWNKAIRNIYITHQLQFFTGNTFTSLCLKYGHHLVTRNFDEVWIPDDPLHSLSGDLSKGKNTKFCGRLSRLEIIEKEKDIDWLLLISGPEPQRSIFEKKLLEIFRGRNAVMVRGTNRSFNPVEHSLIEVHNLASRKVMEELLARSKVVVCRSGYSTIMDLSGTGSKAVFVPTPGQPEQEYLARFHTPNGIPVISQDELSIEKLNNAHCRIQFTTNNLLAERVSELMNFLR